MEIYKVDFKEIHVKIKLCLKDGYQNQDGVL